MGRAILSAIHITIACVLIAYALIALFTILVSGSTVSAAFGASATLRFEIQNAIPTVQPSGIVWTHNGRTTLNSLSQLNGAGLSFSSDYLTLTISNINCNSKGRFQFTATNVAGSDSSYTDLYLIGKYVLLDICMLLMFQSFVCMYMRTHAPSF